MASTSSIPRKTNPVICVFCGASKGTTDEHLAAARALATAMHAAGAHLVYGGGTVGLMGQVAKTLVSLSGPGSVHGVIPRPLVGWGAPEARSADLSDADVAAAIDAEQYGRTTVVRDMHARKRLMHGLTAAGGPGSGFVALTGGFGTAEELFEMTTWNQLNISTLPVVLFNVAGFWDGLLRWVDDAVAAGFLAPPNKGILRSAGDAEGVMRELREYQLSPARLGVTWPKDSQ